MQVLDLTDAAATKNCFEVCKPAFIINLASVASVGNSFEKAESILRVNTTLMLSLLEAMKTVVPTARLLQISSAAVYGQLNEEAAVSQDEQAPLQPINPYAVSKLSQEFLARAYARSYKLDIVFARPFNHIGERQTTAFAISSFAHQIVEIERGVADHIEVGNLTAVRDFSDVKDIVRAYVLLLKKGVSGEVYNIGSGKGYSMQQMLDMLIKKSFVDVLVQENKALMRPLDIPVSIADNGKITALGWKSQYPIEQTVERIIDWHRNQ